MYGYIYKTTNLVNGKIYIGQHKGEFTKNYLGSGTCLRYALKKYGKDNFNVIPVDYCRDVEEMNFKESFWINFFDSRNPDIGYNIMVGGRGYEQLEIYNQHKSESAKLRKPHTEETKYKIALSKVGKHRDDIVRKKLSVYWKTYWKVHDYKKERSHIKFCRNNKSCSEETKRLISYKVKLYWENNKENILTDEYRQSLSEKMKGRFAGSKHPLFGKHPTEDTKKKISKSLQEYKKRIIQFDKQGNFICGYESIHEASRCTGISASYISSCCRGYAKSCFGYVFKYESE